MGVYVLTPAEDLANQVAYEFAQLKKAGVEKVDFSQLVVNVLRSNQISDPISFRSLKSEIAKIFAKRRAEKKNEAEKPPARRPRKVVASQRSFRFAVLKIG